jgi:hypothetical protein
MNNQTKPQLIILPRTPKLSVCMIVCNEEKMLPRCLKSGQGVVEQSTTLSLW